MVAQRLLDINPDLDLTMVNQFLDPAKAEELVTASGGGGEMGAKPYDYVVDCIGKCETVVWSGGVELLPESCDHRTSASCPR